MTKAEFLWHQQLILYQLFQDRGLLLNLSYNKSAQVQLNQLANSRYCLLCYNACRRTGCRWSKALIYRC